MAMFIQARKNDDSVRYFCCGRYDKDGLFSGIVEGYEGGGVISNGFVYKDKRLPEYLDGEALEGDTVKEAFDFLVEEYGFTSDSLLEEIKEHLTLNNISLEWEIKDVSTELFQDRVLSSGMKKRPPSYGLTSWEPSPIEYWEWDEIIDILRGKYQDETVTFLGNQNYEGFDGRIVNVLQDEDGSIYVSLLDMEDCIFDVNFSELEFS